MVDDTISRQQAIDAVSKLLKGIFVEYKDVAEKTIGKIPSAQPERKTATWIDDDGQEVKHGLCANCSACGEWSEYLTDFCPNCGADMRK